MPKLNKREENEWSQGLFGCFDNLSECALAFFLGPCYQMWLHRENNEHCCSCVFGGLVPLRTKMRINKGIKVSFLNHISSIFDLDLK